MSSIATEILDMKSTILLKYNDYFNSKYLGATRSMYMQNEYLIALDIYLMQCEYYEDAQSETVVDIDEWNIDEWDIYNTIEQFVRYSNLMKKGYYD